MPLKKRPAFTIAELLVVIAIIFLVMALALPATRRVRGAAEKMQCASNMRQLVIATHNYHNDFKAFPPGCISAGTNPESRLSWMVAILPYMEQDKLFKSIDISKGFDGNYPAIETKLKNLQCPAAATPLNQSVTHYVAMSGIGKEAAFQPVRTAGNGFMGYDRITTLGMIQVTDGISNTIALIETGFELGPWARGGIATLRGFDPTVNPWAGEQRPFGGFHYKTNVAFVDGAVRDQRNTQNPKTLAAAITIAGGESFDWEE